MAHLVPVWTVALAATAVAAPLTAASPTVTRTPAATNPSISAAVAVPAGYRTVYVAGTVADISDPKATAGSVAAYGDTERQTDAALEKIGRVLQANGAGFGDVVMLRVYLVGSPSNGGAMDFAGMNRAYARRFGTAAQPNLPARSTVQVAGLARPGLLVQIEAVAALKPAP